MSDDVDSTKLGGRPVLVVDDDKAFCAALAAAIRRRGASTVIAHGYDDAVDEAKAWRPDRAVVDMRMPGRSGLELIAELKKIDSEIRIVVLTGYGSIATAVEAMKLGAIHYLTKPAEVDEVCAAFDRVEANLVSPPPPVQEMSLQELEWEHLQRVLHDAGGNVSEAARRLGMHRRSLQRKLARKPGEN